MHSRAHELVDKLLSCLTNAVSLAVPAVDFVQQFIFVRDIQEPFGHPANGLELRMSGYEASWIPIGVENTIQSFFGFLGSLATAVSLNSVEYGFDARDFCEAR